MTTVSLSIYPEKPADRDAWILANRSIRNPVNASRPYAFFVEDERSASGEIVPIATIFLTNRECPWRCLMCDLWKNTLPGTVAPGAIPAQIDFALTRMPPARQTKLYNSGSFFDPRAIPTSDYAAIAKLGTGFERVIVESHPALINDHCLAFHDLVDGRLEVAMGLETANPGVLERLNKRMTLASFAAAAEKLTLHDIDLRVFILVKPPFMLEEEALEWAARSVDFAFKCGATAMTLIPTRGGNGALEQLSTSGDFAPPRLATLEAALDYGISLKRGRVFADLWDLRVQGGCPVCREERVDRLRLMNLQQVLLASVSCRECGVDN
ncbi:putative Fe-S oxidoreductase [Acidisarcina polymorpha]|uniref:Putative Fe-S oxidoreductase n=1 Tax=Acidisarcina polymorpha TaxID=2211140 RepID=A0A2Z5G8B9_9BACT|nr:hypothetical protein [Acidisarcina polymorpha]AXC15230.1 putative Fe-S oxidoreductase [Acidisarcina polymorpha]